MFPSYKAGLFLIELPYAIWKELAQGTLGEMTAQCTLLHEYMHFLQDTATYFGLLYRKGTFLQISSGVMAPDMKGANMVDSEKVQAKVTVVNGRLMYGNLVAGSIMLKENMAVVAQHYVFDDTNARNIPTSDNYNALTYYIWQEIPALRFSYLLTFALYEMALCTEDPVGALQQLITYFKQIALDRKTRYYTEEEQIGWFYDEGEACLENAGLIDYAKIKSENKTDSTIDTLVDDSLASLPCECGKLEGHQQKYRIFSYFKQKSLSNLALRINRPTVIARSLIEYKESRDVNCLYRKFGRPYILSVDDKGIVHTNITELV